MKYVNYNNLSKTHIFLSEIRITGLSEEFQYYPYSLDCIVNVTDQSICLYPGVAPVNGLRENAFASLMYNNIKDIYVSICRRSQELSNSIKKNIYNIDMIIRLKNNETYQIETCSWDNFIKMIDILYNNNVHVDDPIHIYNNYKEYGTKYFVELDKIYDQLVGIYDLIFYRGNNVREV